MGKHNDVAVSQNEEVRGGDFLQLYQRQSRTYLYRDLSGQPRVVTPKTALAEEQIQAIGGDVIWRLETPGMLWSGTAVVNGSKGHFCLKDAMSGLYLHAQPGTGVSDTLTFDANYDCPEAQWLLRVFDNDTQAVVYGKTLFSLESVATGRRLVRGEDTVVSADGADEDEQALVQSFQAGKLFDLACVPANEVSEDDLFVFLAISSDALQDFLDMRHKLEILDMYTRKVKAAETRLTDNKDESGQKVKKKDAVSHRKTVVATVKTHMSGFAAEDEDGPVISVLKAILMKLSISSDLNPLTRDGMLNEPLQILLTELRMVPIVVDMIAATMDFLTPEAVEEKTFGPIFLELTQLCMRVLTVMVSKKREETNSNFLFKKLNYLVTFLQYKHFNVAAVISALFNGQTKLLRNIPTTFIEDVWKRTMKHKQPATVEFLCGLLESNGKPIKLNQDRVIKIVTSEDEPIPEEFYDASTFDADKLPVILQRVDDRSSAPRKLLRHLSKEEEQVELENREAEEKYRFHVSVVKLAALMSAGRHRDSIDFFLVAPQFNFCKSASAMKLPPVLQRLLPASARSAAYSSVLAIIKDSRCSSLTREAFVRLMFAL